jgi:hypothetical protein
MFGFGMTTTKALALLRESLQLTPDEEREFDREFEQYRALAMQFVRSYPNSADAYQEEHLIRYFDDVCTNGRTNIREALWKRENGKISPQGRRLLVSALGQLTGSFNGFMQWNGAHYIIHDKAKFKCLESSCLLTAQVLREVEPRVNVRYFHQLLLEQRKRQNWDVPKEDQDAFLELARIFY